MSRHRKLDPADELQAERLVRAGVRQALVAELLHVSPRTIRRTLQRRRVAVSEMTTDEILAEVSASVDAALAGEPLGRPAAQRPRRRRGPDWQTAARRVEQLEREAAELGLDGG